MNAQTPRRFVGFLKATVLGGIFVLFPVVVLAIIAGTLAVVELIRSKGQALTDWAILLIAIALVADKL